MFNTLVSLLAVFNIATSNPRYPTYQYCSDMYSNTLVNVPSLQDYYSGLSFYNDCKCEIDAKLYYNSAINWSLQDFYFVFDWSIYDYDSVNQEYFVTEHIFSEFDYSGYAYTNETIDLFRFDIEIHAEGGTNTVTIDFINDGESFKTINYMLDFMVKYDVDFDLYLNGQYLISDISSYINSTVGYTDGFNDGYNEGYENGYDNGYSDGNTNGYQSGYTSGYTEGATQDETAVVIFSGIISIALIPINFFLACLNFEVFGINIGAFVSALLTVAIVVIITRMIVSGGNGGDK